MKALSIRQPWAHLIHYGKDIENRNWYTKYRGPVLIHASGWWNKEGVFADLLGAALMLAPSGRANFTTNIMNDLKAQTGGIGGIANIVDCVEESKSPWFFGRYGFVLADARPLPFHPCKGALGFFNVEWPPADAPAANEVAA